MTLMTPTAYMATSDRQRLTALVLGDVERLSRMMDVRDEREAAGEPCDDLDAALDAALGLEPLRIREQWTSILSDYMVARSRGPFLSALAIEADMQALSDQVSWPTGSALTAEDDCGQPMSAQPCMSAITTNAPPVLSIHSGAPA